MKCFYVFPVPNKTLTYRNNIDDISYLCDLQKRKKKYGLLPSHLAFSYYHRDYYSHVVAWLSCISLVYDTWVD